MGENVRFMGESVMQTCSRCGKPIDALAPRGVCVHCVLQAGLLPPVADLESVSAQDRAQSQGSAGGDDDDQSGEASGARPELAGLGTVVLARFGDYELLEEIARGGMGIVYKARQVSLNRLVALKMILAGQFASKQEVLRFRVEAEAAANLHHPNIVAIYETGEHQGQHFFSMEYVAGPNLSQLVGNRPLNAQLAARYTLAIARAIHYAHGQNTLHRDLKPSNVLVDAADQPRITDFGLMRRLRGPYGLTVTGQMLGSPNFMPPEQCGMLSMRSHQREEAQSAESESQNPASEMEPGLVTSAVAKRMAGPWSDVYGIGAILYHLLTARPPFQAETVQDVLLQLRERDPVSPRLLNPSVPRDLETICLKCLEKEPDQRYATAQTLADELDRFLNHEPVHARSVTRIERVWRWCRRKPALATFIGATALLLLTVLIGSPIFAYRINQALKWAEAGELTARQNQYASDMFRAHEAIKEDDLFSALRLLDRNRPSFEDPASASSSNLSAPRAPDLKALQTDLRGWEWRYLWQQCQGDQLFILGYHSNGVSAVGFLPDGKTAYSAGRDNAVRLWDVESRQQIGLLAHDYPVTTAACSPDGRWLATSTSRLFATSTKDQDPRGALRLWDLATRREAAVLTSNFWFRPNSTVFSPDSQLLAFVDVYSGVHLWNVSARDEVANIPAYFRITSSLGLAFSPDGQTLAYNANHSGEIVLWDIPNREPREPKLKGHHLYAPSLAFTPDGRILVSGSMDRTIRLWDLAAGSERAAFTNYPDGISLVRMSPDGKTLAIAATIGHQQITVQDTLTGTIAGQLRGHQRPVSDAAFSPNGRTLISGSWDGSVRVWDVTGRPKEPDSRPFQTGIGELSGGSGAALLLSPGGRHLLSVFTDNTFSICEVPTLTESPRHPLPLSRFSCGALAPDGNRAAFVAKDGNVVFWHAATGQTNWFARPISDASNRAVFSPDGTRLAIAGRREVCVMDVASKRKLHRFAFTEGIDVMSLAFSHDGQKLLAGFDFGLVKAWDLSARSQEVSLEGPGEQVRGLALLPDGRTLVSAARDIRFWDLNSGRPPSVFKLRTTGFYGCSVSPDGRRLAIGAADRRITIWDLASGQEVTTLQGHEGRVDDVCFLSDGNTLVSVGVDQLRVWRAPSFEEIALAEKSRSGRE